MADRRLDEPAHPPPRLIGPGDTAEANSSTSLAVAMRGITKRFGSVVACNGVDLEVRTGEVHGLLGQNGAGKSTLMKILTGLLTPDAGTIVVRGKRVVVRDPRAAADMGIAMVHQHFSVIEALTVWENVALGDRSKIDKKQAIEQTEALSKRYGLAVDARARVKDLTAGQRQRVEIIKCLRRDPTLLVLDEPTSVLTLHESEELFMTLRATVAEEGRAIVLISHKLDEILNATDRVTIMRDGSVVVRVDTSTTDAETLAREMVGQPVALRSVASALGLVQIAEDVAAAGATEVASTSVQPVLSVRDARVRGPDGRLLLDGLSLDVHRGEILGLAGVEGNGQAALANVLSSLIPLDSGVIEVEGMPIRTGRPGAMIAAGIAVIPEDRHAAGCVLDMSVGENLVLNDLDRVSRGQRVSRRAIRERAIELIERFDIKTPSPDVPMRELSGGNQQRVLLARELSRGPSLLVAAQPTHGLDVGAVAYISEQIREAADSGVGVLLISTELEEIIAMSDRVAVIHSGKIMGVLRRREFDAEAIALMMGGRAM